MSFRIRVGISTCLLGENVRYDGGHKLDRYLTDTLGKYFDYVPVCPEVECGLPVPREAMHLEGDPQSPKLVTTRTHRDLTEQMQSWTEKRVAELEGENLSGFIFKANSPSSGMERVRVYNSHGVPRKVGVGLFARALLDRFPTLPAEEEGRLHDPLIRENFIERVFAYQRWRVLRSARPARGALVSFHTTHKLLLLSHSPRHCSALGRLVAEAKSIQPAKLFTSYETQFMEALKQKATVKKHINVLQHMLGYFKKQLSSDEKQEVLELIDRYAEGHLPLLAPLTLIQHYVRKYDEPFLKMQWYLSPHPMELALRNHA